MPFQPFFLTRDFVGMMMFDDLFVLFEDRRDDDDNGDVGVGDDDRIIRA